MKNKEAWKEFDEQYLTPYRNEGTESQYFAPEDIVFSYLSIRDITFTAFQAGVNSVKNSSG